MDVKDLTVIIPVHKINDTIKDYLNNAIKSVIEQKSKPEFIKIIYSGEDINQLNDVIDKYKDNIDISIIINEGLSDFVSQINLGVSKTETKWFSILEFDDVYSPIWFDNVLKYIESKTNVSVFIPINNVYDASNGKFISFVNEVIWANAFSNELGYIDNDCLKDYFNFQLDGAVFNTHDFIDVGGLKSSIKLSFWYEYLLRATANDQLVYVIPKIGYHHIMLREDSLMQHYSQEITPEEGAWWINLAKTECNFKEDRKIEYIKS
jgi:hypothetical protein